jgi:hypothetical protein
MKGYFSRLAQHTGLNFDPGVNGALNGLSSESATYAARESREEIAPLHGEATTFSEEIAPLYGEATTFSDSPAPVTKDESFDNAAAPAPDKASQESALLSRSLDASNTTTNSASFSNSNATNFQDPEPSPAPERLQLDPSAESHNFTITESEVMPQTQAAVARPRSGVRQIIPLAQEPGLEQDNLAPGAPRATLDTLIEISPPTTSEESQIRFEYYDPGTSQPRIQLREPSPAPRMVEFLEEHSPATRTESIPEFAGHDQIQRDRNQVGGSAPASAKWSEQEAAVRNYMKEVRAWVATSPADEGPLEQEDWSDVREQPGNVFALEDETNAVSVPRDELPADKGVQELSLSIGNISIVIEEPQKNLPALATPPSIERSHVETASEPTSLSRYYLRPW